MRFNLTSLSGYTVTIATLKLYVNSSLSAGFTVNQVSNNTWAESQINFNNAPAPGTVIHTSGSVTSGAWVSIDITPYITGNGLYSVSLDSLSATNLALASRESGTHAPQLVVSLSAGSGQTNTPAPNKTPTPTTGKAPTSVASGTVPSFSHVIIMMFENKEYGSVAGSSAWPNFNNLAKQYTSLTALDAVSHPSLPNYLAITSGSTQGVTSDCTTCYNGATNITDSVEASGRTWKAYMETMPSACYSGSSGTYVQKHNPFVYYNDIRNNATRCKSDGVPLTQLDTDLANNHLPNFVWISPNLCNDAHDCSGATGDTFLGKEVARIMNSPAFDAKSLLIVTFDEGSSSASCCGMPSSGDGHIATLLISSLAKTGFQDATPYSLYSLLKTIEKSWGMPYLAHAGDAATSLINDAWK